jgi:hypothetical protein
VCKTLPGSFSPPQAIPILVSKVEILRRFRG